MNRIASILVLLVAVLGFTAQAQKQPHVYINPGHGGHTSNDRNVVVPGYVQGDTAGFWESNASLKKGFALMEALKKKGYITSISRIRNEEEDDLNLSTIVSLCNSSGADVFFSLHSNATGAGEGYRINFPLGLYRGYTGQPQVAHSDELTAILQPFLYANKATVWTSNYAIYGDWTFYPDWGTQGLGVLRGNKAVAMLQEGSFHDYIPEALRLMNDGYCWTEGWNVSLAADKYFERPSTLNVGVLTGCLRDDRILRSGILVMHGIDNREPICNATVRLLDANGAEVARTTTDKDRNGIYTFKYVTPGTYTVEVSEAEHFTQSKTVEVVVDTPTYCNFDMKRVRTTPPAVVSYSPVWNDGDAPVLCNEPIVLNFNWDMDVPSTEAAFTITPAVEGKFTWEDTNYRMIFTPNDAYDINTEYTVTLKKTAQHGGGTEMENDFTIKFKTTSRNHLEPIAVFPYEGAPVHYSSVNVEFRADSLLKALNLYTLFHILDKDGNEVAMAKRSIKTNKKGDPYGYIRIPLSGSLNVGETYTLNVDGEVGDTVGIHLAAPLSYKFTAVDAGEAKPETELVNGLETVDVMTAGGNYKTATLTASSTKLFGNKALQLKYDFTGIEAPGINLDFATAPELTFTGNDTIGVHVNGDLSYNEVVAVFETASIIGDIDGDNSVDVTDLNCAINVILGLESADTYEGRGDVTGDGKVDVADINYIIDIILNSESASEAPTTRNVEVSLGKINYNGWRYVKANVNAAGATYKLKGLKLVTDKNNKMGQSGTVIFDDVLKKKGETGAVLDNVKIGPNPASDYLVASADNYIQGVELVDANGKIMARNAANYINVSNIANGAYVMKVYVNNLVSTHKVVVKH